MTNKQKKAAAALAKADAKASAEGKSNDVAPATPARKEKGGAAELKAVAAAGKAGIKSFPKADIIAGLNALADGKATEATAAGEAVNASLAIVRTCESYGVQAHSECNDDTSTVLDHWKSNLQLVAIELAAAGSPFAKTSTNKAGDTVGQLTGTGNNVMSIAKGVVDFRLAVDECSNEEGEVTYRTVRTAVEAKRAERRAEDNPEAAALAAAKEAVRESFKELTGIVFASDDIGLINELNVTLIELRQLEVANAEAQEKATAEAAANDAENDEADKLAADTAAQVEEMVANQ